MPDSAQMKSGGGPSLRSTLRPDDFEFLFKGSANIYALLDLDGKFTFVTGASETLGGVQAGEMAGRSFSEFLHGPAKDRDLFAALGSNAGASMAAEIELAGADDRPVTAGITARYVVDASGAATAIECIMRPIGTGADALRQAQKMEAVEQLTGGLAHDFNNILAGLLGNLHLMGDEEMSAEELGARLERAKSIVQRGADLTRQLLAFSRKQALHPEPVDVEAMIGNMFDLINRSLGEAIKINLDFAEDMWLSQVDNHQLENAVLNLAINARDAMPDGGELSILGRNCRSDELAGVMMLELEAGDYIALSVEDTGHGMAKDMAALVFDPFFTTKEFGKGSGLGLSMVYGFAKQSGGYVNFDSTEGVGSKVTMYLPRADAIRTARQAAPARAKPSKGHGERIMIIEDDPDVRDATTTALLGLGYKVIDGGDGSEAVSIGNAETELIDLLLTDVVLPGGNNGPDLAEALSRKWRDMKILLMTGYAERDVLHNTDDVLKYPLIQKPFDTADLSNRIADILAE
jgi:signal transduction histidine kinase